MLPIRTPTFETNYPNEPSVLILRTCDADLKAYEGFQWPESGHVKAPDWSPTSECGNGLHGLLWGEGGVHYLNYGNMESMWLVCEVPEASIVDLGDKVKFPEAYVVFCGARDPAVTFLKENGAGDKAVVFSNTMVGDFGTATAGEGGIATAGDWGTATAGDWGTATAGYSGTATAGEGGTATAGDKGTLLIKYWDEAASRYKLATAYVGEKGIKADTSYILNERHEFVEKV